MGPDEGSFKDLYKLFIDGIEIAGFWTEETIQFQFEEKLLRNIMREFYKTAQDNNGAFWVFEELAEELWEVGETEVTRIEEIPIAVTTFQVRIKFPKDPQGYDSVCGFSFKITHEQLEMQRRTETEMLQLHMAIQLRKDYFRTAAAATSSNLSELHPQATAVDYIKKLQG